MHNYSGLREALDSDLKTLSPAFEPVERHVATLFTANPRADPMSMRKPNFLITVKATLPTKSQTFTHLHLPHGDKRNPVCMAAALKEHWGPLWTRDSPSPILISDYLSTPRGLVRFPLSPLNPFLPCSLRDATPPQALMAYPFLCVASSPTSWLPSWRTF
jgi:hypothetical protein